LNIKKCLTLQNAYDYKITFLKEGKKKDVKWSDISAFEQKIVLN